MYTVKRCTESWRRHLTGSSSMITGLGRPKCTIFAATVNDTSVELIPKTYFQHSTPLHGIIDSHWQPLQLHDRGRACRAPLPILLFWLSNQRTLPSFTTPETSRRHNNSPHRLARPLPQTKAFQALRHDSLLPNRTNVGAEPRRPRKLTSMTLIQSACSAKLLMSVACDLPQCCFLVLQVFRVALRLFEEPRPHIPGFPDCR